jgi:hypothetical protein
MSNSESLMDLSMRTLSCTTSLFSVIWFNMRAKTFNEVNIFNQDIVYLLLNSGSRALVTGRIHYTGGQQEGLSRIPRTATIVSHFELYSVKNDVYFRLLTLFKSLPRMNEIRLLHLSKALGHSCRLIIGSSLKFEPISLGNIIICCSLFVGWLFHNKKLLIQQLRTCISLILAGLICILRNKVSLLGVKRTRTQFRQEISKMRIYKWTVITFIRH